MRNITSPLCVALLAAVLCLPSAPTSAALVETVRLQVGVLKGIDGAMGLSLSRPDSIMPQSLALAPSLIVPVLQPATRWEASPAVTENAVSVPVRTIFSNAPSKTNASASAANQKSERTALQDLVRLEQTGSKSSVNAGSSWDGSSRASSSRKSRKKTAARKKRRSSGRETAEDNSRPSNSGLDPDGSARDLDELGNPKRSRNEDNPDSVGNPARGDDGPDSARDEFGGGSNNSGLF